MGSTVHKGDPGGKEKVTKANFQSNGKLLVKTKDAAQTEKLLKARWFGDEECTVEKDKKLNQSRGTIFAYDLLDLSEEEIVGWLGHSRTNRPKISKINTLIFHKNLKLGL